MGIADPRVLRHHAQLTLQGKRQANADGQTIDRRDQWLLQIGIAGLTTTAPVEQRVVGLPRTTAAYLTLCNGRLTARECYEQSIVNKVVPRAKLMETCEQMAEMICDSSPLAVQAAVRLYRLTAAFDPALVSYARHLDQEIAESEDGAEGPRAFREKRKPVWKMR